MAYVSATGEVQPEQGDILPLEVAVRDDDPAHIREFIAQVNPTITDSEQLAQAIQHVDRMRQDWREQQGLKDNPHINADAGTGISVTEQPTKVPLMERARGFTG